MSLETPHFYTGTKNNTQPDKIETNKYYTYILSAADDETALNMLTEVCRNALVDADAVIKENKKEKEKKRRQWLIDSVKENSPQEVESKKIPCRIWYSLKLLFFMFFSFPGLWIKESWKAPNSDGTSEELVMSLFLASSLIAFPLYYVALFVGVVVLVLTFFSSSITFCNLLIPLKFSGLCYLVGLVSSLLFWDLQASQNSALAIAIISLVITVILG